MAEVVAFLFGLCAGYLALELPQLVTKRRFEEIRRGHADRPMR